jgi:plasmid stability protein
MSQLLVRNLDPGVKARLKRRAKRHGRSVEEEVRQILREAARADHVPRHDLGSRIVARFRTAWLNEDLPELRGQPARAADLDE